MAVLGIIGIIIVVLVGLGILMGVRTIDQAHVGVVTMFGKYRRTIDPGLNFIIPFIEKVHQRVPVQNQTIPMEFAAITNDQAAVHFKATIIFTVSDHLPETIQLVAYKFITPKAFSLAMTSAVEAAVREFVATKKQAEVLGLRTEIASHAKDNLNEQLASWGYRLVDLAINDISFDPEVMTSMSRVVAATNAQRAAEFEGQALLIKKTKEAEAEGAFIRISAENEATAAQLRGQGLANFRVELAKGFTAAADELERNGVDTSILTFTLWTETIRDMARDGKGNVLFLDAGVGAHDETLQRLTGMLARQTGLASSAPTATGTAGQTAGPTAGPLNETH